MKNAMKKLMSLLLVAVLLVSAIPFAALAAEYEPAPFLEGGNIVYQVMVIYDDGTPTYVSDTHTVPENTSAYDAACAVLGVEKITELAGKYNFRYNSQTIDESINGMLVINCDLKNVTVPQYAVTVRINGGSTSNPKLLEKNTKLTLNNNLLSQFALTLPEGYVIDSFRINGNTYNVGAEYIIDGDCEIVVYTKTGNSSNGAGSETAKQSIYWEIKNVEGGKVVKNGSFTPNNDTAAVKDILYYHVYNKSNSWQNDYSCTKAWSTKQQKDVGYDGSVAAGDIVTIVLSPKNGNVDGNGSNGTGSNNTTGTVTFKNYEGGNMYTATITNGKLTATDVNNATNAATRSGYTFAGWKVNNAGSAAASDLLLNMTFSNGDALYPTYTANSNSLSSTKNQNDIFLNIFVNKDFQNCKTIKLNDHWVIADDKITKDEILQYVVTDYYKASNTNLGLQADMLYYSVGSFMYNWLTDNGTLTIDNISAKRAQGTVTVNIMVTNATAKTTTAVASDNPKTGDSIYTAVAVMGISAASLAAVMYFYNKKRMAI